MSADRLKEAARVLRERALKAAPHPWESIAAGAWTGRVFAADSEMVAKVSTEVSDDHSNAEYIATMHPGVALALADWLDLIGNSWSDPHADPHVDLDGWRVEFEESTDTHGLKIADLILGTTS